MSRLSQPAQSVEQQKKQAFVTGLFIVNHRYLTFHLLRVLGIDYVCNTPMRRSGGHYHVTCPAHLAYYKSAALMTQLSQGIKPRLRNIFFPH